MNTTFDELHETSSSEIVKAVLALTKDKNVPKEGETLDSPARIKTLLKEVWAAKLADGITNLQAPPAHWSSKKYRNTKLA